MVDLAGAGLAAAGRRPQRDGSQGFLDMATVPSTRMKVKVKGPTSRAKNSREMGHPTTASISAATKVKVPILAAKNAARMGHPSVSSSSEPGRFGVYGGRYVPETLMAALEELERQYERAKRDPKNSNRGCGGCYGRMRDVRLH